MMERGYLEQHYLLQKKSVSQIAIECGCSENKVNYWLTKHNIKKRTISDALYLKHNPNGDPFMYKHPATADEYFLFALGIGLFWGEGNKMDKNSVRLGNTDPDLVYLFLRFLRQIYQIDERKLRFGLQLFNDIPKAEALSFWINRLNVRKEQFQKIVLTKSFKRGTYRQKSKYGVLTVYFSNTKLRDIIMSAITELRTNRDAILAQSVERIHGKSQ